MTPQAALYYFLYRIFGARPYCTGADSFETISLNYDLADRLISYCLPERLWLENRERNVEIVKRRIGLIEGDNTYAAIGPIFNLSPERIKQIVAKMERVIRNNLQRRRLTIEMVMKEDFKG